MRGSRTTGSDRLAPADPSAKAASGGKGVGRPRRLTTEQVLQAAVEIGLEQLTMSAVARRLGVSITVLYGYVSSRDELLRLAAAHASRRHRFPEGAGLSWPLYVTRYAASLFALLTSPGHSIAHYVTLGVGPSAEIDNAEAWMETLACKGFTAHEAHILQRQMGEIVLGGAVAYLHHRRLE